MAGGLAGNRVVRQGGALLVLGGPLALVLAVAGSARLERADLVINNGSEVSTLDPALVSGVPEGRVMYALYEGLTVKHPESLEPLPGMADRWEVSEDGRVYTFHIREDARWNNGDPLTAHDFEWSWKRVLTAETAAEYAYQLWYVENGRAYTMMPDDRFYGHVTHGQWIQKTDANRARLGLHGFLAVEDPEVPFRVAVSPGERIEMHDPIVVAGTGTGTGTGTGAEGDFHLHTHVGGRVLAVNEELPATLAEVLLEPYEANWLVEIELDPGSVQRAINEEELYTAADARRELFWQRVGIEALDDRNLLVQLESPTPFFIHLVSFYTTFPVHRPTIEWAQREFPDTWGIEWVRPENIVTNGPYQLKERRVNDRIRLEKNPEYWDADNVAMRTIDVLAVEHYGTMINLYLTGEVDWVDRCAPNLIPRMMPREDFNPRPYLGTYFYRVNVDRPPMDDARVRRALALAIDRRAICEKIMKKGEQPSWSLCPGGLHGYPRPEMEHAPVAPDLADYDEAFAADCERAAALLMEAGYGPDGKDFPTIEIHYNTSEAHRDTAEVVADTWKRVLGIDAKLLNQEWKVYLDTQNTISYDVSRSAWIGDYPDPNTFVDLFVTGGENNRTGWGNARFDQLVARATREGDPEVRMGLLAEAEAILLDELPILPIYSYVSQNFVNPRLGGWHENVQDNHYAKFFYWMDDEELAAKRAAQPADWERAAAPGPTEGLYSPASMEARVTER